MRRNNRIQDSGFRGQGRKRAFTSLYPASRILFPLLLLTFAGCADTLNKLEGVGKAPPHDAVKDPTREPGYEPISWPLPEQKAPSQQYANSLWQPGSRSFFRDQRASRAGDILKVTIKINDKILSDNESEGKRQTTDTASFPELGGVQKKVAHLFSGSGQPGAFIDTAGLHDTKSTGKITRQDQIQTQVAAMVTQVLPNGNFVIEGKEEILMNYEMREISIKGVVRPSDITPDNTVDSSQVAQARITYGGHGQLMDMQQPRWGDQVLDIVSPF